MPAGVAEVFSDGGSGKRSIVLQRGGIGGGGGHDYGVVHRALLAQRLHYGRNRRAFLPHSHVDTIYGIAVQVALALIDDSVDGNCGLAGLAVADNQLALAAADRNHRVYGLQARLQRLVHGLAEDDARSLALEGHTHRLALYRAQAVQRRAYRVHDPAHEALAHVDAGYATQPAHGHIFLHLVGRTQQHGAYIVFLEVHHHGLDAAVEFEEFARLGLGKAVDTGHAVADGKYVADFFIFQRSVHPPELFEEYIGDFAGFYSVLCHR